MTLNHAKPQVIYWEGDYPDWQSACVASSGYSTKEIFIKVRDAARAVRDGKALWERDSVLFYQEEYNLPLLAALMSVAAWNQGRLCVLDFGGALGCTYTQHRSQFRKLTAHTWNVVEQSHMVECGRSEFENEHLKFWYNMEECCAAQKVDVIIFSSVLSYIEEPYALLEKATGFSPMAVIVDLTMFAKSGERISVQHVSEEIYPASYPCRWMDKQRVEDILQKHYPHIRWWPSAVGTEFGYLGVMGY